MVAAPSVSGVCSFISVSLSRSGASVAPQGLLPDCRGVIAPALSSRAPASRRQARGGRAALRSAYLNPCAGLRLGNPSLRVDEQSTTDGLAWASTILGHRIQGRSA
ncbi:hypothetical protein MEX01_28750 [Methylorubrum extorquens]|nr:hypothetical protein MEX01_28750 [Methylorubrum extorquens]